MRAEPEDNPGVRLPPPVIYAVPLAAGLLLHHWRTLPALGPEAARVFGPALVLCGFVGVPAMVAFIRARTNPRPWKPASVLVTSGPYRFTRNPMYLGFTLLYAGVSLSVNTLWPLLALPVILFVMTTGVIAREENYLERRFGDEYLRYKARVRRWL
jgi:protein-S-isoprenylcysteine O-methyltransferase Ste14